VDNASGDYIVGVDDDMILARDCVMEYVSSWGEIQRSNS
jgi:hypothetical protein